MKDTFDWLIVILAVGVIFAVVTVLANCAIPIHVNPPELVEER